MKLNEIPAGINVPDDIYVIIEIPVNHHSVKYEIDKKSGIIFVDRFIPIKLLYPCNYGYINNTLSLDGDPLDALVITPCPILPGSVIHCRPIGMINMQDECGIDNKILSVPDNQLSEEYNNIKNIKDLDNTTKKQITYFFENYKNLEKNKWTKINGWEDVKTAKEEIMLSLKRKLS